MVQPQIWMIRVSYYWFDGWTTLSGGLGEATSVSVCVGAFVHLDSVDACLGRSLGLVIFGFEVDVC
jgi:hypothetical protein